MVEKIVHNNVTLAIIIKHEYSNQGIEFFTDADHSQQLGYMKRDKGYVIAPHRHNIVPREVRLTQEVLFIKNGKVRVDFYDNAQHYIKSRVIQKGDVILLADGGHGFEIIEEAEIIEVKQGPYRPEEDKVRFDAVQSDDLDFN